MPRRMLAVCLLIMLFLTACSGRQQETPAPTADPSAVSLAAFLEWTVQTEPNAVRVYLEDAGSETYTDDPRQVADLWQAAGRITVGAPGQNPVEGKYHYAEFLFADGSSLAVFLNDVSLDMGETLYALNGGEDFFALLQTLGRSE